MLTRLHKILVALLAVQVGLAVFVVTRRDDSSAHTPHAVLAGFDAAAVTQLAVYGKDGTKPAVTLSKRADKWVVSSSFDYPVVDSKVSDLLASIAKMSAASPIATQSSRHKQLRVGDADFERKLVITAAGGETTLLLGSPAGSRRTAVRRTGDPSVYAVSGLNVWSIGTEPHDWIDTSYLKVGADEVEKIVIDTAHDPAHVEIERDGDHWKATIAGAPIKLTGGETIDTAALQRLVTAAMSIDVRAPADPKRDATKPTATITIVRKAQAGSAAASTGSAAAQAASAATSGPPVIIDVIADADAYWVHDRASAKAALVDKNRLSEIVDISRDKLVAKPSAAATPGAPPHAAPNASLPPAMPGAPNMPLPPGP